MRHISVRTMLQVSDAGPGRVMREIVGKSIQAEMMLAGESILQSGGAAG